MRSILGFLSSAIVDRRGPYVPRRSNVNAATTPASRWRRTHNPGGESAPLRARRLLGQRDPRARRMLAPAVYSRQPIPTSSLAQASSLSPSHLASASPSGTPTSAASGPGFVNLRVLVDRQLRLVHLQPRAVPRRARGQGRGLQERRHRRRRHPRAGRRTALLISPGPVHAERGGHLARAPAARSVASCPSSACASGTRPSGRRTAAASCAPRA